MFPTNITGLLTSGSAVTVPVGALALPLTVWVRPGSGDTVTVQYSVDGANWVAWPNGAATAYSEDILDSQIHSLRFTRSSGSGTTSAYGVL